MGWFRKKQKEVAQNFVEDVKEEVKESAKKSTTNWLKLILFAAPVVIPIADHVIGTGMVSAPDLPKGNFTLYIDTVNINIKGGM